MSANRGKILSNYVCLISEDKSWGTDPSNHTLLSIIIISTSSIISSFSLLSQFQESRESSL